ncbi:MAG: hypothetical protein ABJN26_05080 [Stappiaceae bacterium]
MFNTLYKIGLISILITPILVTPGIARPSLLEMTCAGSNALIRSLGSVTIDIKPGIYRRFVAKRTMCVHGQKGFKLKAAVAGGKQCKVKYACRNILESDQPTNAGNAPSPSPAPAPGPATTVNDGNGTVIID